MTVMCVKQIPNRCDISGEAMLVPEIGDTDTVIDIEKNIWGVFYCLERFGLENCYQAYYFATLPSTTEEIGIEAEQEALIYQR